MADFNEPSPQAIQQTGPAMPKRHLSEEHRRKISEKQKANWENRKAAAGSTQQEDAVPAISHPPPATLPEPEVPESTPESPTESSSNWWLWMLLGSILTTTLLSQPAKTNFRLH